MVEWPQKPLSFRIGFASHTRGANCHPGRSSGIAGPRRTRARAGDRMSARRDERASSGRASPRRSRICVELLAVLDRLHGDGTVLGRGPRRSAPGHPRDRGAEHVVVVNDEDAGWRHGGSDPPTKPFDPQRSLPVIGGYVFMAQRGFVGHVSPETFRRKVARRIKVARWRLGLTQTRPPRRFGWA